MKTIILCILVLASAATWLFFPTSLSAQHETFRLLSGSDFSRIRGNAIALSDSLAQKGIEVLPGDEDSQSIQFNCHGVPVFTLINGPAIMSMLVYVDADQRAPDVARFREQLYPHLMRTGSSPNLHAVRPSAFGAFVLKHRDGVDISSDCSRSSGS